MKPSYRSLPATWLECVGHHWAIKECSFYLKLTKKKFIAESDHLALVSMTKKPLEDLPGKLRDLFIDLRCYNYFTVFNLGLKMEISDMLSRSVHWTKDKEEEEAEKDEADRRVLHEALARQVIGATVSDYIWRDPLLQPIIEQASKDPEYKTVLELLKSEEGKGFEPTREAFEEVLGKFKINNKRGYDFLIKASDEFKDSVFILCKRIIE